MLSFQTCCCKTFIATEFQIGSPNSPSSSMGTLNTPTTPWYMSIFQLMCQGVLTYQNENPNKPLTLCSGDLCNFIRSDKNDIKGIVFQILSQIFSLNRAIPTDNRNFLGENQRLCLEGHAQSCKKKQAFGDSLQTLIRDLCSKKQMNSLHLGFITTQQRI